MDVVDAIKRQVDLVAYIGRFTPLQKSGRSYRGLCPFHTEKTPSFYVFPERGTWRCFGACGEGGDLFTFVEKRENVDFRGALRILAAEAGIQLHEDDPKRRSHIERLAAIVSAAVGFYERQLREPEGAEALDYLSRSARPLAGNRRRLAPRLGARRMAPPARFPPQPRLHRPRYGGRRRAG
jgi:DNA primase